MFIRTLSIILVVLISTGCGNSEVEDSALGAFVHASQLNRSCRMPLENIKYTHVEKHTAGKLNDPAYIVGISFMCANSVTGKTPWQVYVGYVPTREGGANCVAWNGDLDLLRNGMSWLGCGGLN